MTRVVLDPSALHPAPVRDLLLRVACAGLCEARVSPQIVDLYVADRLGERPELPAAAFAPTRALLTGGLPDLVVDAPPALLESVTLCDERQRAPLAAALLTDAELILTRTPEAYDQETLALFGVEARHPDEFLLELVGRAPTKLFAIVSHQARALPDAPVSLATLLRALKAQGLPRTIDELCAHYYGAGI